MNAHRVYRLSNVVCMNQVAKHNNPVKNSVIEIVEYCHLKDLDLPVIENEDIDLVIENNYEELLDMAEVCQSDQCRLTAKLSKFGWVLVVYAGPRDDGDTNAPEYERHSINSCASIHENNVNWSLNNGLSGNETPYVRSGNVNSCKLLHAQINHCINAGFNLRPDDEDVAPSINDNKCQMIYETSVKKIDGRYSINLP